MNIIPNFQIHHSEKRCNCGALREETITYELQIKVISHNQMPRFLAYYEPLYYTNFINKPKIIGINSGLGYESLEEAIEKLNEARELSRNNN
jgi:hypothetical protein